MISKKDEAILNILRENCKLSTREISNRTRIPITTVHNRIKRMEREGIIKNYVAVVDNRKLGKNIQAFIQVNVVYTTPTGKPVSQEELAKKIYMMPEVHACYIMAGSIDILLHAVVKDVDELNNFVITRLRNMEGVGNTMTSVILTDVTEKVRKAAPVVM